MKTIKNEIHLDGVGLHNGLKVKLVIKPSEPNSGIIFKRTDIDENKKPLIYYRSEYQDLK